MGEASIPYLGLFLDAHFRNEGFYSSLNPVSLFYKEITHDFDKLSHKNQFF